MYNRSIATIICTVFIDVNHMIILTDDEGSSQDLFNGMHTCLQILVIMELKLHKVVAKTDKPRMPFDILSSYV